MIAELKPATHAGLPRDEARPSVWCGRNARVQLCRRLGLCRHPSGQILVPARGTRASAFATELGLRAHIVCRTTRRRPRSPSRHCFSPSYVPVKLE